MQDMATKGDPRVSAKGKALAKACLTANPWCVYCGANATEADHITPLAQGGSHTLDNLQSTCGPCNRSKGTKRGPKTVAGLNAKVLSEGVHNARGEVVEGTHGHLGKESGHADKSKPTPVGPTVVVTHGAWSV